jgi:cleavage and polyadenylation specificity factor subunit 2
VHGKEKSTKDMEEYCQKQQIVQDRIFTPKVGEVVNATLETQIYNVKLKDELVSSLKFQKFKDYELAWVDAVIKPNNKDSETYSNEQPVSSTNSGDTGFSLHPIPKDLLQAHKTVFVNEPKLSDLKQILTQNSIQAEFHGGVLVCNGIIALKKVGFYIYIFLM